MSKLSQVINNIFGSPPPPPTPPDPSVTIQLQQAANLESARQSGILSAIDTTSPFGNVTFQRRTSGPLAGTAEAQNISLPADVEAAIAEQNRLRLGLSERASGILEGVPEGGFQIPGGLPGLTTGLGSLPQGQDLSFAGLPGVSQGPQIAGPSGPAGVTSQGLPGVNQDFAGARDIQTQAAFDRFSSLRDPGFEQDSQRLEQDIANRGIDPGGEDAQRLRENLQRSQGEQRERAAFSAIGVGAQEAGRLFGQEQAARGQQFGERLGEFETGTAARGAASQEALQAFQSALSGRQQLGQEAQQQFTAGQIPRDQAIQEALLNAQFAQTARGTGISEELLQRQQSTAEIANILSGSPSIQQPSAPPIPQIGVGGTDVLGAFGLQQQGQQFGAQLQAQRDASRFGGLASLGGALGSAAIFSSSRDWKENKTPIDHNETLEKVKSLSVERWNYLPELVGEPEPATHIGPYAEDFQERFGGESDTSIDVIDALGVAMSAIKGLAAQVDDLKEQIREAA